MTEEQAGTLLFTMQAAWDGFAENDATNLMWMTILMRADPKLGSHAVKLLISHHPRKPAAADWYSALRSAHAAITAPPALPEPTQTDGTTMRRVLAQYRIAADDREKRLRELSADDFIRSEGHDPATHHLSRSGFVLRRPPRRTPEEIRASERRLARAERSQR